MGRPEKPMKPQRDPASAVAWTPTDLMHRYRISPATRRRWERERRLPPRDFFLNGEPYGWRVETILRMERGEVETA
jgi:hypothetical protein